MIEDELSVIELWIVTTLTEHPLLAPILGGRIFDNPPPEGTLYPYVIYTMSSADDVRGVGTTRIMSDTLYTVKAVASTEQTRELGEVAGTLDAALTLAQPVDVGNPVVGTVLSSVRQRIVKFSEYSAGKHYSHRGGDYQIIAQTN